MEDIGVIDMSPKEGAFGTTKSHTTSAKNKLIRAYEYEKEYDRGELNNDATGSHLESTSITLSDPQSSNKEFSDDPVTTSEAMTDSELTHFKVIPAEPQKPTKSSRKKNVTKHANSSKTEETSSIISDHTLTYPEYPTYGDYEEGLAPGGPSYDYEDYQVGETLVRLPYDFSGLQVGH